MLLFLIPKSCLTEKIQLQTSIVFRDSESCMSYLQLVTKINTENFPTTEQQFVQRCETKVSADACKDSYLYVSFPCHFFQGLSTVKSLAPLCSSTTSTLFSEHFFKAEPHSKGRAKKEKDCPGGLLGKKPFSFS